MGYRRRIEDGNEIFERSTSGGTKWFKVESGDVPAKVKAQLKSVEYRPPSGPAGNRHYRLQHSKTNKAEEKLGEWDEAELESMAALQRKQDAIDMPWWEASLIHAGRESDKLVAGTKDIGHIIKGMAGQDIDENLANRKALAFEQSENDRMYKQLDEESFGTKISKIAPYIATGYSEPFIAKGLGKTVEMLGAGAGRAATTAVNQGRTLRGRSANAIKKQYEKLNVPEDIDKQIRAAIDSAGQKIKSEVGDPISGYVSHVKARPELETPMKGSLNKIAASGTLGTAEGAAHYDESLIDGALSSVIGTGFGLAAKNTLSQSHNWNTPSENETLKKWKDVYGYRPIPGEETGKVEIQQESARLRTDKKAASGMRSYDNANMKVISEQAALASGMTGNQLRNIDKNSLNAHIIQLKKTFDDLEDQSRGPINIDDFDEVIKSLDDHPKLVRKHIEDAILSMGDSIDGKTYKQIRSKLKKYADSAADNNKPYYSAYKDTINTLDKAMESAVGDTHGPDILARWNKAREEYAMTNFMIENAMDANHGIDMKKLSSKLMSTDAKRLLTGTGGNVGKFHDIASLSAIQQKQADGGLSRSSGNNSDPNFEGWGYFSTPGAGDMGPIESLGFKLYMLGYPNKFGLLGLPRKGIASSEMLSRASQQGNDYVSDPLVWASGKAMDGYNFINDLLSTEEDRNN